MVDGIATRIKKKSVFTIVENSKGSGDCKIFYLSKKRCGIRYLFEMGIFLCNRHN